MKTLILIIITALNLAALVAVVFGTAEIIKFDRSK